MLHLFMGRKYLESLREGVRKPPGKIKNKNETLGEVLLQETDMSSSALRGFEK